MTPSAEHTDTAPAIPLPAEAIEDGDEIIFVIKPSGWFVLLSSWPVIVAAVLVGAIATLFKFAGPYQAVPLVCTAVVCMRVMVACIQWMGMLYILTNRRVIRLRGVAKVEVRACPLREIAEAQLVSGLYEGMLGLASLVFVLHDGKSAAFCWPSVAAPKEVQDAITAAIKRAK